MNRPDPEYALRRDAKRINEKLNSILPSESHKPISLHRAMRHSVLCGGKRIRGLLCLWSHEVNGQRYPASALKAACAIELLHTYTLIHDDLPSLDDDDIRRGKPSCHIKYGPAIAILAGDALQALAFETLVGCEEAPYENTIRAARILSRSAGSCHLVGGQVADIESEGSYLSREKVEFIHSNKTAELIAASLSIGALLSKGEGEDSKNMYQIGKKIGFAFQIVDDLIDLEGDAEIVGKALRKDAQKGKVTYPAVYGIEGSRKKAGKLVQEALDGLKNYPDTFKLEFLFNRILKRIR
jgi:geranylgeranyl diphosphate synthase type II